MAAKTIKRAVSKEHLLSYLEARGMTLQQVASAIGVGDKTLSKNVGEGYLSLTAALDIAAFMDAKFDVLFGPDISQDWGKFAKTAKKYLQ